MKLLANPAVVQFAVLFAVICAILVVGALVVGAMRREMLSGTKALHAPTRTEDANFALAACQGVIAGLKQNVQQLQSSVASERVRAEHAEAARALLLENIDTGVVVIGKNLLVQAANPAARRLLGYQSPMNMHAREVFQGLRTVELPSTNGALTGISLAIRDVISNGVEYRGVPACYATPAGESRTLRLTLLPVPGQTSEQALVMCLIGADVSTRESV